MTVKNYHPRNDWTWFARRLNPSVFPLNVGKRTKTVGIFKRKKKTVSDLALFRSLSAQNYGSKLFRYIEDVEAPENEKTQLNFVSESAMRNHYQLYTMCTIISSTSFLLLAF